MATKKQIKDLKRICIRIDKYARRDMSESKYFGFGLGLVRIKLSYVMLLRKSSTNVFLDFPAFLSRVWWPL